jgi:hypothetical protein
MKRIICSANISCSRTARSTVGIYKSLTDTHECGNWDCGRAISFLGIFISNFRYWFFAVREEKDCKVRYIDFIGFFEKNGRDLKEGRILENNLSNIKVKMCFNFSRIGLNFEVQCNNIC